MPAQPTVRCRPTWPWWLAAAIYYLAGCLGHLPFSLWLVRQRPALAANFAFANLVPWVVIASGLALAAFAIHQVRHSPQPRVLGGYWLFWLACVVTVDFTLTYTVNEYAHYPQYALLTLLVARAMDPRRQKWPIGRVLFWVTLGGAADEVLQYLWTTRSYSDYVDFNDFVVNLLAAALGVLLYWGTATRRDETKHPRGWLRPDWIATFVLATGLVGSLLSGRLMVTPSQPAPPGGITQGAYGTVINLQRSSAHYGSWKPSRRHGVYYVLAPGSGLLLLGGLFGAFALWPHLRSRQRNLHADATLR